MPRVLLTPEERKARARACQLRWQQANRERILAYKREWYHHDKQMKQLLQSAQ